MKSIQQLADLKLLDAEGIEVAFGSFWEDRPAILVFLRHFG